MRMYKQTTCLPAGTSTSYTLGYRPHSTIEEKSTASRWCSSSKRPAVRVTINGYTYRSTVAPYTGAFMLPLAAEHRAGAGVAAGDEVEVDLELATDTAPGHRAARLRGRARR